MKMGTKVRMSERCKIKLCEMDSADHVKEFGDCDGIVIGPADGLGSGIIDVRWQPSGLRYAYWAEELEEIREN